jgi:hypothetical protein
MVWLGLGICVAVAGTGTPVFLSEPEFSSTQGRSVVSDVFIVARIGSSISQESGSRLSPLFKRSVVDRCKTPMGYRSLPYKRQIPNNATSCSLPGPATARVAVVSAVHLFQLGSGPCDSSCTSPVQSAQSVGAGSVIQSSGMLTPAILVLSPAAIGSCLDVPWYVSAYVSA